MSAVFGINLELYGLFSKTLTATILDRCQSEVSQLTWKITCPLYIIKHIKMLYSF